MYVCKNPDAMGLQWLLLGNHGHVVLGSYH